MSSSLNGPTEGSSSNQEDPLVQQQQEREEQRQDKQELEQQDHSCRREFHALFFGRRHSARYRQHQTEAAAAEQLVDPFRLAQYDETRERQQRINKQLRLQLLLGVSILLLFVVTFSVIVSLLLHKDDSREYLRMEPRLGALAGSGGGDSDGGGGGSVGLVRLDRNNDDDLAGVLARIGAELSDYEIRRWYPRLLKSGRRPKDCDSLGTYPLPNREVCVPQLTGQLGACNVYTAFGYLVGDPCVLVKPGPALTGNYTEDLLLNCRAGVLDPRAGSIGQELSLKYHPRVVHHGQMYGYFPRFYFPYPRDESFYLAPMVMVQIVKPPRGRSFLLNCSLANWAFANASTQATLEFLLE